jgi:hypothetical protein
LSLLDELVESRARDREVLTYLERAEQLLGHGETPITS